MRVIDACLHGKACLIVLSILASSLAFAENYDLKADWSDNSNPNGVWSYNDGVGPITAHQDEYLNELHPTPNSQPVWANTVSGVGHIVSWFRVNNSSCQTIYDAEIGDILTHTWDASSGGQVTFPDSNVTWTSPKHGQINIDGGVWLARNQGRAVNWKLELNGALLTEGQLDSYDDYERSNPSPLNLGDQSLLWNIPVNAGDILRLSLITDLSRAISSQQYGEFVGVNMNVSFNATPATPNLVSPNGNVSGSPTFIWVHVPNVEFYRLYIKNVDMNETVYLDNHSTSYFNCQQNGTCTFTLPQSLSNARYSWAVRSGNQVGWSEFSDRMYFDVSN